MRSRKLEFQPTPPRGRRRDFREGWARPYMRFNPRLRAGGDVISTTGEMEWQEFQPTPPRGRRRCQHCPAGAARRCFNPRLRAGGDRHQASCRPRCRCFNPRLRAGGDGLQKAEALLAGCFNPRLRAGGDGLAGRRRRIGIPVSTHASAREATRRQIALSQTQVVSTHASAREATPLLLRRAYRSTSFNPRLRAGGDAATACRA